MFPTSLFLAIADTPTHQDAAVPGEQRRLQRRGAGR
jgi:hypothetical protein